MPNTILMPTTRDHRRGIILISTLVLVLILGTLIGVAQSKLQSATVVLARLEVSQRDAMAEQAIRERFRPLLAAIFTGKTSAVDIPLDGTTLEVEQGGRTYSVQINDVSGLVDIYFASRDILNVLPTGSATLFNGRREAVAKLPQGARYIALEQSLAQFGMLRPKRGMLDGLVTQSGMPIPINPEVAPLTIRPALQRLVLPASHSRPLTRLIFAVSPKSSSG